MSKIAKVLIAAGMLAASGCSYGSIAITPDGSSAIIALNDGLLYGALRKIFACKVVDGALGECAETTAP